jgi:hypothetical protein
LTVGKSDKWGVQQTIAIDKANAKALGFQLPGRTGISAIAARYTICRIGRTIADRPADNRRFTTRSKAHETLNVIFFDTA